MLRILVLIECDICDGVLSEIADARDDRRDCIRDADEKIHAKIHNLQLIAEERGWQSMNDSSVHRCSDCLRG